VGVGVSFPLPFWNRNAAAILAAAALLRLYDLGLKPLHHDEGVNGVFLVRLLREARGEAVGFCWDARIGAALEPIADRLFCAVGEPGDDFRPIQALGYRWNLAVPAEDPAVLLRVAAAIERDFPPVLFPAGLDEEQP